MQFFYRMPETIETIIVFYLLWLIMNEVDQKNRIIETARTKFLSLGFSKVTMDELVAQLGISKKTMYQYFKSKDDLVTAVLETQIVFMSTNIKKILDAPVDFIEKLNTLWVFVGDSLSGISKQFQDDIRRFRPELWQRVEEVRRQNVFGNLRTLFEEGQRHGMLREDVNVEIVVAMFQDAVQGIVNPEVLVRHPFSAADAMRAIMRVLFEGVLTESARNSYRMKSIKENRT
jgi:AcrR family transcriptional regulator